MTALPIVAVGLSVLGVAALYALHHLRTQPKRRAAATLIFWQQAARPQQTRVPWSRRFTHRKTFALLAAIVLLMGAAMLADAFSAGRPAERDVIVLDGGQGMAATNAAGESLFRQAVVVAEDEIGRHGTTPAVITAGPIPLVMADAGTPAGGVRRLLSTLKPQAGASASSLALRLAASVQGQRPGRIIWITPQPSLPDDLPPAIAQRIDRRPLRAAESLAIVGVNRIRTAAASGAAGLRITLAGAAASPATLRIVIDGTQTITRPVSLTDGRSEVRVDDLPVAAKHVELSLTGGPDVATRAVAVDLPDTRPMTFRTLGPVPEALRAALRTFADERPDGELAVIAGDAAAPVNTAAILRVVPATTNAAASLLRLTHGTSAVSLEQARVTLVPATALPGTPLLNANDVTVASLSERGEMRTLFLSESLLADTADLPRRAAFPVLVSDWCERLLNRQSETTALPLLRMADDPLWPQAGDPAATRVIAVADRPIETTSAAASDSPTTGASRGTFPLKQLLLGLAVTLLLVEGLLLARRKTV